jgi:DNA-binding transcriptional MerR regulator
MADVHDTSYLSIGEVLGLLLEEFPDVTISKIRFLESQGLISPERTPSGYRKFYDDDVQLLRVILAEQRQNYLPLRVIKDRLEAGEIDPTGEHLRPNDDESNDVTDVRSSSPTRAPASELDDHTGEVEFAEVPAASIAAHPARRGMPPVSSSNGTGVRTAASDPSESEGVAAQLLPGVLLDRAELCAMVGMTDEELSQLESFGVVAPRDSSGMTVYGDEAVEIARPACEFLRAGVDARHLRNWRTSAEREASLYEQLVTPRFRQRNPESRAEALAQLKHLDGLGATLRAAMTRHALRHHFEA